MDERLGRQVQVEPKFRGWPALAFSKHHLVEFVSGRRIVIVTVVGGTVDIDHLGHGEDLLEAIQDEGAALALGGGILLANCHMASGRLRIRLAGANWLIDFLAAGPFFSNDRLRPQWHGQHRQIARRCLRRHFITCRERGKPRATAQEINDAVLQHPLHPRQRAAAALRQEGAAKPTIAIDQTGEGLQDLRFKRRRRVQKCKICLEGISLGHRLKRHYGHGGGQPDIEVKIERLLRHEIQDWGQHHASFVPRRMNELFFAQPHALPKLQPMLRCLAPRRYQLNRPFAAEATKADREYRKHVFEQDSRIGVTRPGAGITGKPVPRAPDRLLKLQKVQHDILLADDRLCQFEECSTHVRFVGQRLDHGGTNGVPWRKTGIDEARAVNQQTRRDALLQVMTFQCPQPPRQFDQWLYSRGRQSTFCRDNLDLPGLGQEVELDGDSAVLLELAGILQDLELDWEYELSRWLGPVGSQLLGGHLRSRVSWTSQALDSLRLNLADYLSEESRSLVGQREADARFAELDNLKLALDRLDARIERLAQLHKPQT